MHLITSIEGNSVLYFLANNTYIIGRKSCDFLIENDTSISRKHASITYKDGEVILTDLNSKYNTFVNGVKLEPNIDKILQNNDVITFGILTSTFKLEEVKIKTTCSGLASDDKKKLSQNLKLLNGTLATSWSEDCTHVTVRELKLTVKLLCGLIVGQPIVTLKYWKDFINSVAGKTKPPNVDDYKPVCSEPMLKRNAPLKYEPARRSLFEDKILVFRANATKNNMEIIIKLAGGECISWEETKLTKQQINNSHPEYLFILDNDVPDTPTDDSFVAMTKYLEGRGKRSIPLQEVGLAVFQCSCEQDCNPNFQRSKTLAEKKPELEFAQSMLVEETQSQHKIEKETKTEIVVPPTVEEDFFPVDRGPTTSTQIDMEVKSSKVEPGVKREAEMYEGDCKRFKVEEKQLSQNPFGSIRRTSTQNKVKDNKVSAFFQQQSGKSDISSIVIMDSQSDKKRKADVDDEPKKVTKKPSIERDNFPSTSFQSKTSKTVNPFSRVSKPKPPPSPVVDELVDMKPRWNVNVVAADRLMQSTANCTWLSKSSRVSDHSSDRSDGLDDIVSIYIKSFRNSIVSEKTPMIVRKRPVVDVVTAQSNKRNFKTFKKVIPIIQSTIVPKAEYV